MTKYALVLEPKTHWSIGGLVAFHLTTLHLQILNWRNCRGQYPDLEELPEFEIDNYEAVEKYYIDALTACLHLLNEKLVFAILTEKYSYSDEDAGYWIDVAKENMDKYPPC